MMSKKITTILLNIVKTMAIPVVVYVLFYIISKLTTGNSFGSWASINIILQQAVLNSFVGWAMSFNMLNKRWDFSVGSIVILGAIIGSNIAQNLGWGAWGALLFCLITCTILGIINGCVQIVVSAPTLVTGFGLLMVYETVETIVFDGRGAHLNVGSNMTMLGTAPWIYIIAIVFAVLHFVIYKYTKFGYHNRLVSNNTAVAKSIGVSENRDIMMSYVFCGIFAGAAAVIYMSFRGSVEVSTDMGTAQTVFDAMLPVFLGMFISKYSNLTIGIYIGSLTVKLITAGLMACGVSSTLQSVASGILLFVIIAYSSNEENMKQNRLTRKAKKAIQGQ